MTYNEWLEIEVKRLNDENDNIKHFFSYDELDFLDEITELNNEKRYWLDNFKRLRDDNIKLTEENEQLQDENKQLKQELFNLYLKHYN